MDTAWRIARLAWSPRSLPQAALEVPLLAGVKGGFIGWFLLSGILCGPAGAAATRGHLCAECVLSMVATVLACGITGSIIIMTLLVLLVPLREDETTFSGRARLNVWLMLPFCALLPAAVWAALAVAANPQMDVGAPAAWLAQRAIVRAVASSAGVIAIALFALAWGSWAQLSARQRLTSGRCIACGYLLIGLIERRCPECGTKAFEGQQIEPLNPPPRPR